VPSMLPTATTCMLLIGDRVVLRANAPPEAEYIFFEIGDIELRSAEPGRVREHGYQTTVERARARLAQLGATSALAHECANTMQPVLAAAYARGPAATHVARYLGPLELFQAEHYDAGAHVYRGLFIDLAAIVADLRMPTAAVAMQALYLAMLLEKEADETTVFLSTDAWTYWEYGRIAAIHDGDPYVDTPNAFPNDPAYDKAGADWRDTTSVYGPAFTLVSEAVALAAGTSAAAAAWIFKVLAALGVLACTLLAARLARDKPSAAALVGWNPLFAIHFAGGGHNDSILIALTLGALALAAAGRKQLAGAAWAFAVLIKWVPLVFFALRAVAARAARRPVGHAGFAVMAAAIIGLATTRYGLDWVRSVGPLARNAAEQSSYALPHRLEQLGVPHALTFVLTLTALAAGLLWLGREAARGRVRLGLAGCLLLATTPWLTPWYAIWAVPLAAAEDDRRAQLISLAFCAYLLPQAIPV